jgi:uncharacterized membrane protein
LSTVRESVEVDVALHTAYDQWTQFTEFPRFMEGVDRVTQLDERHNRWHVSIAGVHREFETEIVDQLPDERITWRTTSGDVKQHGMVSFQPVDEERTRVSVAMEFQPTDMVEQAADLTGSVNRRVKGDLSRFKSFIEHRGQQEGAWRGRIAPGG